MATISEGADDASGLTPARPALATGHGATAHRVRNRHQPEER